MVIKEGTLGGDRLHESVLILDNAGRDGLIHIPQHRDAPPRLAVKHFLRRSRAVDNVVGSPEKLGDQLTFGDIDGLNQMGGQKTILRHGGGRQGKFGDFAPDQVQIRCALCALRKKLNEACVVNAVIIIMGAMHVQRGFGNGARANIKHIGQPLPGGGVQRFMHERDALGGREIGCAKPRHGHARRNGGGGVLRFRLNKNQ